jgi:predicted hydrocarbon binding protein
MNTALASASTIRLPAGSLRALRRAAAAAGASPSALLRELGATCGEEMTEGLRARLSERRGTSDPGELALDAFWEQLSGYLEEMGWGRLEVEQPHPAVVLLSSSSWLEADEELGVRHPACHFTTGALSALFSEVAGAEVSALEIECRSAGGARCAWLAGGTEALGVAYEALRREEDPLAALSERDGG